MRPTLKTIQTQLAILALAGGLFLLPASPVEAQADTTIDITLEGIVILHYFSNLDVTIDSTAIAALLSPLTAPETDEGTPSANPFTVSAFPFSIDADLATDITSPTATLTAVDLELQNVWAVRAITAPATPNIAMTTSVQTSTMNHGTTGDIEITGSAVSPTSFASPGLVNPQFGDVTLTLDLTDASLTGAYSGGVYRVVATPSV